MKNILKNYLSQRPKYKLAFDLSSTLDVESVDTGIYLSNVLTSKVSKKNLDMYAGETLRAMIRLHTHDHPEYGRYVALSNIGILFEPSLAFNLETIIEQTSKDLLMIIQAKGKIDNERFYYLSPQNHLTINLKNLTYTVIE